MTDHIHKWEILGFIIKPNIKKHYHNNIVFFCVNCDMIHVVVRNRIADVIEFKNLDKLAEVCLQYRWIAKVWPKL